ncbi:phosphatidylethanolamine-binding protein [Dichomitus squalens]|uniref:Phosphatidylethanolamine-binding protein n=1 Tax=Dichomitus squalens TaxID=114155 RepID=A0A4Q9PUX4_9APHY|nr:phosphatidylethanolamine-binding protein [Dichomitus squalens]
MFAKLFSLATLATVVAAQTSNVTIAQVAQAFSAASIVPIVIPTFNPTGLLGVVFFDNTTNLNVTVTPGQNLTREQNALRPTVSFTSNDTSLASQTFVLAMVDPDAPTPQNPTEAEIRHLLAPNITLSGSLADGALLVNNTPAISDFLRPTPPAGSDPHRYILLLFVQPANFSQVAPNFVNASTPVSNFNISLFAVEAGLGSPVAGNFFLTGPDNTSTPASGSSSASAAASTNTSPSGSAGTSAGAAASSGASNAASMMMGMEKLSVVGITIAMCIMGMLVL